MAVVQPQITQERERTDRNPFFVLQTKNFTFKLPRQTNNLLHSSVFCHLRFYSSLVMSRESTVHNVCFNLPSHETFGHPRNHGDWLRFGLYDVFLAIDATETLCVDRR